MEKAQNVSHADVVQHHIWALTTGQLDEILKDYSDDAVLMSVDASFHGPAEIGAFFQAALATMPPELIAALTPLRQDQHGDVVFVAWKAEPFVKQAIDTFVFRDGKIVTQTFLIPS
jgi:ketosteroid isomerase-like protein